MSPFTKNLAHHTTPLRELLKKDTEFHWHPSLDNIFNDIKERICAQTTLVYYNPHKQSILQVDASGYGLGATIPQEGRPVAFASKSLSPAETRYTNIEREMLTIVFGCERFHNYIYGTRFIIHSDHKPYIYIYICISKDFPKERYCTCVYLCHLIIRYCHLAVLFR